MGHPANVSAVDLAAPNPPLLPRPTAVEPRAGLRIWIQFDDGKSGEIDLSHLRGMGMFKAWEDRAFFESVRIEHGFGFVSWGDDFIDLCPDDLYMRLTGKTLEELGSQPSPLGPPGIT